MSPTRTASGFMYDATHRPTELEPGQRPRIRRAASIPVEETRNTTLPRSLRSRYRQRDTAVNILVTCDEFGPGRSSSVSSRTRRAGCRAGSPKISSTRACDTGSPGPPARWSGAPYCRPHGCGCVDRQHRPGRQGCDRRTPRRVVRSAEFVSSAANIDRAAAPPYSRSSMALVSEVPSSIGTIFAPQVLRPRSGRLRPVNRDVASCVRCRYRRRRYCTHRSPGSLFRY